jgi:hypothetical protein
MDSDSDSSDDCMGRKALLKASSTARVAKKQQPQPKNKQRVLVVPSRGITYR